MSNRSIELDDRIHAYMMGVSLREDPIARRLRDTTAAMPEHNMQIAPEQGQFMAMLVKLLGARHCIEVGVFTGYSTLLVAAALPKDGRIVACDISADYTSIAQPFWEEADVAGRIDLRLGPALDTLADLLAAEGPDGFDFAFIDADKSHYDDYYESCLSLVKPGGVIAIDNTLWHGTVADPTVKDRDTEAIRALNRKLHTDPRIDLSLVPIGDGLTLCRKR
ncbi:MAG: class I SAM-dependent methyltransferase [Gammaproteobacteria bacterium]|nr:class I SAM-dependent methyltransferase [Gammaproteobacteria bacterium]